jgi:pantoate--beta-alanine ligase
MKTVRTIAALRAEPRTGVVGLVPTMGALHAGHEALLHAARDECDTVIASLFVNPAQFGESADLASYPRSEATDTAAAEAAGVDILFAPGVDEMYPRGFQTWVEVESVSQGLEGASRPGHFRGVATVVLKLFTIAAPDRAYFGRKDAQQVAVIKQMTRDLALPVEIRVVPTVRDPDGLALSSRNVHLTAEQRQQALAIPHALATRDPGLARAVLTRAGITPDYVEVADLDGPTLAVAARVGETRLIDNIRLDEEGA